MTTAFRPDCNPEIREEFYLLCVLRFGTDTLTYPNDFPIFSNFRMELYPDYFSDTTIPCMDLADYLQWCKERKHAA